MSIYVIFLLYYMWNGRIFIWLSTLPDSCCMFDSVFVKCFQCESCFVLGWRMKRSVDMVALMCTHAGMVVRM